MFVNRIGKEVRFVTKLFWRSWVKEALSSQLSMPEVMLRTRYLINARQLLSHIKLRCDLCYCMSFNLYQKDVPEMLRGKTPSIEERTNPAQCSGKQKLQTCSLYYETKRVKFI